jgi:hypothetical protein
MNNEQNKQTAIELGVLPELIKDGKAFAALALVQENEHKQYVAKYRRLLYKKMDTILGYDAPRQKVSYKYWFMNPERFVNEAFLKNERRNPHKWQIIVNAMYFALTETLMEAVNETRQQLKFYKERESALSTSLEVYLKSIEKAA